MPIRTRAGLIQRFAAVPPPPPPGALPNTNCYVESEADVVVVSDMAALQTAINAAPPGRHIKIASGTYTGGTRTFDPSGTSANPIVVRTASGRGTVTINSPTWTLAAGSSRLVLKDLYFNNPLITLNGSNHRVTRCRIRQIDRSSVYIPGAINSRVDHCDFSDYVSGASDPRCVSWTSTGIGNGTVHDILLDYNYIHDLADPGQAAAFYYGGGATAQWDANGKIIVDHNLIVNANSGTGEFFNIKSSGWKIRYCTFDNVTSYLYQRQGGGWELRSNWFENMQMSQDAPVFGFDHYYAGNLSGAGRALVIGNRIVGQHFRGPSAGNGGSDTAPPPTSQPYHRSREGQYIGNICVQMQVGQGWTETTPALNNNLWDNTATRINVLEQGTTTLNPATNPPADPPTNTSVTPWYSYTPAVKLTASQVGMAAPDPFCPNGPQS